MIKAGAFFRKQEVWIMHLKSRQLRHAQHSFVKVSEAAQAKEDLNQFKNKGLPGTTGKAFANRQTYCSLRLRRRTGAHSLH